MPKSNFNQFLDECEDFKTFENKTISKINFEPNLHDEYEIENQNQNSNAVTANYTTTSSSSSSSSLAKYSNPFSSNIFLSNNSANGQGQNRFSTKRLNNSNGNNSNDNNVGHNEDARNTRRENNMFKKMSSNQDTNQTAVKCYGGASSSLSTSHIVEINNETFPSLVSASAAVSSTNNTAIPKKFKNFKDAICASPAEPVLSPTKQKQLKAIAMASVKQSNIAHPLAVKAVKKDSEMYAKKILAKTKKFGYDDDEDDADYHTDDDNNEDCAGKSHYIQNFMKRRCNDDNEDSD